MGEKNLRFKFSKWVFRGTLKKMGWPYRPTHQRLLAALTFVVAMAGFASAVTTFCTVTAIAVGAFTFCTLTVIHLFRFLIHLVDAILPKRIHNLSISFFTTWIQVISARLVF